MTNIEITDPDLELHLRRTLVEVASTVPGDAAAAEVPHPRRRRGAKPVLIGVAVLSLATAAFAWVQSGHEYVKQLPPRPALASGTTEGIRWWLVPSFHTDACDQPFPGVEAVTDARNREGQEWDTSGVDYGEPSADPCARDERAWLRDPNRMSGGTSRMGADDDNDSPWITIIALHPSVATVAITINGSTRQVPTLPRSDRPDGPRYVVFTAPPETKTVNLAFLGSDGAQVAAERKWSL